MRKLLLFFFALLTGVSGVWAASPAAGAYPVEGKTYYLYANKYNATNRYYLYWDNTNSALKHTTDGSKESTDYYKWTVTISDGKYTITNVGTGTSLKWNSGLTLGADGLQFDLSKSVNYTACVPLYATIPDGERWLCVKNDTETFANGYKFNAFVNNSDYSINFVFEEVLPAHSLTNGSYYTIYCDNDSKQYLCTNGTALTVTGTVPTAAASNCIWKCIKSGDYYNFQNLATGQYLGWKAMQSSAYNFTVGTSVVLHDGCANVWGVGASRYLNIKVDGAFDQGSGAFNKVTTDYCSDFRFDAITPTFGTFITDLANLSNTKAYVISNARATWNFVDDATAMNVVAAANGYNLVDEAQQIAIVQHESNYYLFSVNANKYLTANNTLTSMPTDNEQVSVTATGNASYPWFFKFKNIANKNVNVTTAPSLTIDNWSTVDAGNSNAIIEAADFDATQALEMFTVRNVTYNLNFNGGSTLDTESDVMVTIGGDPADFVPSKFANPFVSFTYSPAIISAETTEVTVTATWNGPFQISADYASAIWQVVQMHTYPGYPAEKWSWSYKSDDSNKVKPEQVLEYDGVTTNRLFCFVGNPYEGFKIYNAAAGSDYTLTRTGETDEISMASGDHIFTLHASSASPDVSTYFCLKPSGATNYINYDYNNKKIAGWSDADNGSTCWVVAPGQYYLDFIDGLYLDAPVGAVGTRAYFQTVANAETAKNNIRGYRPTVAGNMYSNELSSLNSLLNPVKNSDVITLSDGYYRIISAVPGFNQTAAWYYNPSVSADHITWAKAATTSEQQVNSIFKFEASGDDWNIKSPNAQKYLIHDGTAFGAQTGTIGDEPGTVYVNAIGSAQHSLRINVQTIHANGHDSGSGTSGTLINWNANDLGAASTWYIVKVEDIDLGLNAAGDGYYYATMCLPFDVTLASACAYTLTLNGAKNGLTLSSAISEVPAGTPVLIRYTSDEITATINTGAAFNSGSPLDCALTGTYVDKSVTGDTDYFLGVNSSDEIGFYHWGTGTKTLDANRAYLITDGSFVKGLSLIWDEETGINSIENGKLKIENEAVYDLSGRRVAKPTKGLYIKNGKKTVIK